MALSRSSRLLVARVDGQQVQHLVDEVITVTEDEIASAVRLVRRLALCRLCLPPVPCLHAFLVRVFVRKLMRAYACLRWLPS